MFIRRKAISLACTFMSIFSNDMGLKLGGMLGSFPAFDKVTIIAFNISGGKVAEAAGAL